MDDKLLRITEAAKRLGVTAQTLRNWEKRGQLKAIRFHVSGHRMYKESDLFKLIQQLHEFQEGNSPIFAWAGGTKIYNPPDEFYAPSRDTFQARLERKSHEWIKELGEEKGALLTAVVGEIGNNSFDHNLGNWPDVAGIWFQPSEMSSAVWLADRGVGIFNTLKRVRPDIGDDLEALKVGFHEVVTGRAPEQRGNGLKFVRGVVLNAAHGFSLSFNTGDAHLKIENGLETIENVKKRIQGCIAIINYSKP